MTFKQLVHYAPQKLRLLSWVVLSSTFVFIGTVPARADCPPGSQPVRVETSGDEERTYCKCVPGYVVRGGQCVRRNPVIDPSFFVSPEHEAVINGELQVLRARQSRLQKQLDHLNEMREEQDGYLQEMGQMRQELIYDGISDVLAVVSTAEALARIPGISLELANQLSNSFKAFKFAVDSLASADTKDRTRAQEKALDARSTILSMLAKAGASEKDKEALSKFVEASYEAIKATAANPQAEQKPLADRVAKALDGVAAVTGALYWPVGVTRSAIHATGAGVVVWKIEHDKESLVAALVSLQRARLAADQRLATTNEMIKFYEIELKKAGKP